MPSVKDQIRSNGRFALPSIRCYPKSFRRRSRKTMSYRGNATFSKNSRATTSITTYRVLQVEIRTIETLSSLYAFSSLLPSELIVRVTGSYLYLVTLYLEYVNQLGESV